MSESLVIEATSALDIVAVLYAGDVLVAVKVALRTPLIYSLASGYAVAVIVPHEGVLVAFTPER